MSWKLVAERWLNFSGLDQELKEQLDRVKHDGTKLEELFGKNLEFGTAGMRGEIGPGTNRMNIYTVRKASEGLARYLLSEDEKNAQRGVVIAYDSRHMSPEFALEVAKTIGKHGIKSYLFKELRPTPELSFAVRYLKAAAGVMITASHNPPEYNGYKVYGDDGAQLTPKPAAKLTSFVNDVQDELTVEVVEETELLEKGLLQYVGEEIDQAYLDQLATIQLNKSIVEKMAKELRIVFTPLHGTASRLVKMGLERFGFENVIFVKEQELPDPDFSTVKSPNPEDPEAFELAIQYGKKVDADILLGTDPDSDRLGIVVKNDQDEYVPLTGNQIGAILLHYILSQKKEQGILPENGIMIKTIVTSELGRAIAQDFGVATLDTLTGFKFIGEKIREFERSGQYTFQFGYEESYGCLIGDFVRDKDAVQATLLAAEVAAYYKAQGKTLLDGLREIFEKYGFYRESLQSLTLKGLEGAEKIAQIMDSFRKHPPVELAGVKVIAVEDYLTSVKKELTTGKLDPIKLPKSNVLKYFLEDGSWFCVRPSGTEPKCKFYFAVKGASQEESETLLRNLEDAVMSRIQELVK
mgnify:FL=1